MVGFFILFIPPALMLTLIDAITVSGFSKFVFTKRGLIAIVISCILVREKLCNENRDETTEGLVTMACQKVIFQFLILALYPICSVDGDGMAVCSHPSLERDHHQCLEKH